MKVLGLHFQSEEGMVEDNVRRAVQIAGFWASSHPVDMIILPELFTSGYCCMDLRPYAESTDGPSTHAFANLASQLGAVIGFGFPEVADGQKVYNSYAIIDPGGAVHVYRKTHLHISRPHVIINEPEYMSAGDCLGVVDTSLGRIGIMICYDGHFPEVARCLVLSGASVILWPSRSGGYFGGIGMPSLRARENMVPIVHVEGSQKSEAIVRIAHSVIADHRGGIICELNGCEGVVYGEIDPALAEKDRNEALDVWAMYRARNPDLYEPITRK